MKNYLVTGGAQVIAFAPERPSLEELFISIVGAGSAGGAGGDGEGL